MAETRGDPRTEGRAALRHAGRALFYAALGTAVIIAVSKWWPDDLDASTERTAENVVLGVLALVAVGALWFGLAALVRAARWRRARRWERMLADPSTAALVPPTEAHVDAVPEQPGGVEALAKLVGLSLTAVALVTYGVLAMFDVAPLPESDSGDDLSPGSLLFVALLVIAGVVGAWRAWRTWRISRAVARLADELGPAVGAALHRADVSPRRSATIPPLDVTFIESGPTRGSVRRITADANSFGDPPPPVLYLRLFDNAKGTARFLAGPWREYGYVHLLRSAASVTTDELEAARRAGSADALFITSDAELETVLAGAPLAPERRPEPSDVAAKVLGWVARRRGSADGYPVYPARQLLCHDAVWKRVVDVLLGRVQLVVLDVSGYHREHVGTGYELQRVVDRFPVERVLMLASRTSDVRFLEAQIRAAWSQMAAGSPNAGTAPRSILVDRSEFGDDRAVLARVRQRQGQALAAGGT